jgi:hypothetical protein
MDQLIQQSYRAPEKSQPSSPDPILDDLLAALEHLMLTRGKIVTPLLLETVQARVHRIQQHPRKRHEGITR